MQKEFIAFIDAKIYKAIRPVLIKAGVIKNAQGSLLRFHDKVLSSQVKPVQFSVDVINRNFWELL